MLFLFQLFWQKTSKVINLPDRCLLQVAKSTLDDQDVISVLGQLDRNFISYLKNDIVAPPMMQKITEAKTDADALMYIRQVSC